MNRDIVRRLRVEPLEARTAPTAVPIGGEFRVNTVTTGYQLYSRVASDAAGDFIATWQSTQDGSLDIYAQRYSAAGVPQGSEFRVNTYTINYRRNPAVAMDVAGDFVIAWESYGQDGNNLGIYAKRFSAAGAELPPPAGMPLGLGNEFRVNTYTTGFQDKPSVAMDAVGDFVVTWRGNGLGATNFWRVYAQRFSAAGVPQGSEFHVSTFDPQYEEQPAVAMDAAGDFVVALKSGDAPDYYGVYAQRYNAQGLTQGTTFLVNTYTTSYQQQPAVAMDAVGNFVIAWESWVQNGGDAGVYAKRFSAAGVELPPPTGVPLGLGNEFRVNTFNVNGNTGLNPAVAMNATGYFVITWFAFFQDGDAPGETNVRAQAYRADGSPSGGEFRVNTYTTDSQISEAVAMDAAGDFVVTWRSNGQDGANFGIYAQRYLLVEQPSVTGTVINGGAAQRSRVTTLNVSFNRQVTFAAPTAAAFILTRNADGVAVSFSATANVVGGVTVVTLNSFTGGVTEFGSLTDGRYTLTARATQINADGLQLDGNGDGTPGDDYELVGSPANGLFRLFGDADGNGTVNNLDFAAFRSAFGGSSSIFDFDNNGSVSASGFIQFRLRFGGSI